MKMKIKFGLYSKFYVKLFSTKFLKISLLCFMFISTNNLLITVRQIKASLFYYKAL